MIFNKPPKTFEKQLQLLRKRGMYIADIHSAIHYLSHVNYYRLSAYWLPFEAEHTTHSFRSGTTFENVLNLYLFDRELRLLLLDSIERVEVSIKTKWAYTLAHSYGPHAHLQSIHARKPGLYQENLQRLNTELNRSKERFIAHYRNKYQEPESPPIWSVCEIMSFGLLSRWVKNLRLQELSKISDSYELDPKVLASFVEHLSYVRNLCAHHARVWNRSMTVTMKIPGGKHAGLHRWFNREDTRRVYNTLVMLLHFLDRISPNHRWKQRIMALIEAHAIDITAMGFPKGFEFFPIWEIDRSEETPKRGEETRAKRSVHANKQ